MNPFDYLKSINEHKNIMVDELTEKGYVPFMVNRGLSYFLDTVFQANEMNRLHHVDKKTQYLFLLNTVRPRKRWSGKWHKVEKNGDVEVIMQYHGYSYQKALEVLPLLSVKQIDAIKEALDGGGIVKGKK
jgi:hypothetical protein